MNTKSNPNPPVPVLGLSIGAAALLAVGWLIIANGAPLHVDSCAPVDERARCNPPVTVSKPSPSLDDKIYDQCRVYGDYHDNRNDAAIHCAAEVMARNLADELNKDRGAR
jgi:hypothetical protein